jgi:HK97 family phage portal protein
MISLLRPKAKRSFENPATPLSDPDNWLVDVMGGGKADSGVEVNAGSALRYSPLWRAVNLIAKDVARIPLYVYRRVGEGLEKDPTHPAYRLLRYKSSQEMVAFQLKLVLTADAVLQGNGFGGILRRGDGSPREIVRMNPLSTRVERLDSGRLVYVTRVDSEELPIAPRNVLHIKGMGDGLMGKSLIDVAKDSIGLGLGAEKYGSKYFAEGARPSLALEHSGTLSAGAQARIRNSWVRIHGGLDNAHKPAILEEGMQLKPFGLTNEQSQFLETRQFQARDVANWTGVPPHKLGDTTHTSYNSLEQEEQRYLDEALEPWFSTWEAEIWDKLLREREKRENTHVIEFVRQALLRVDYAARIEGYVKMVTNGLMSRNEIRGRENLNPVPGGDEFMTPLNMSPPGEKGAAGAPDDGSEDDDDDEDRSLSPAQRALVEELLLRMTKRISTNARRWSKKPAKFAVWVEEMLVSGHRDTVVRAADPVLAVLGESGLEVAVEEVADVFFRRVDAHLLQAMEVDPRELERSVDKACERMERSIPLEVLKRIQELGSNGRKTDL